MKGTKATITQQTTKPTNTELPNISQAIAKNPNKTNNNKIPVMNAEPSRSCNTWIMTISSRHPLNRPTPLPLQ